MLILLALLGVAAAAPSCIDPKPLLTDMTVDCAGVSASQWLSKGLGEETRGGLFVLCTEGYDCTRCDGTSLSPRPSLNPRRCAPLSPHLSATPPPHHCHVRARAGPH